MAFLFAALLILVGLSIWWTQTTGVATFTGNLTVSAFYNATLSQTGGGYTGAQATPGVANTITNQLSFKTAGAGAGQVDLPISQNYSIAASSSTSIDLTSLTDVLQRAAQTAVRVKGILIELLNATQDTVTPGTAASSLTIDNTATNALSAQSHSGWFDNAAEGAANGSKFTIPNGGWLAFGVANAAGVVVDPTHKIIKITNNDGALTAIARVTLYCAAE